MKNKILMLLLILFIYAEVAAAESIQVLIPSASNPANKLTSDDGTEFVINGDFNLSFYSDNDIKAEMTVSMAGLSGEKYGLLFFNGTPAKETVYHSEAPDMGTAIGGGAITFSGTRASAEELCPEDFHDYTFEVDIKEGQNTVYAPPFDLTNDCGSFIYTVNGEKCNRGVCFRSITFNKKIINEWVVNVDDIDTKYLTYHQDGYTYPGPDDSDRTARRTVFQSHECMYTAVPFEIEEAGDYIVNVRYNAYTSDIFGLEQKAAVFLDADLSGINNKDWLPFLIDSSLTEEQKQSIVEGKLSGITNNGELKAIDIGTWKCCFSIAGDAKKWPYYNLKSFKLQSLSPGQHTLLFYTARKVLENSGSSVVNRSVLFNSFEFKRVCEQTESVDVFYTPVMTVSDWAAYKFKAFIPDTYVKENSRVYVPVSISNNQNKALQASLAFVYYDSGDKMTSLKITPLTLGAYESSEKTLSFVKPQDAEVQYVKIILIDNDTSEPYFKKVEKIIFSDELGV